VKGAGKAFQIVLGDQGDVLLSFSQGGDVDDKYIEQEKQILSKPA
jgi:hypothetical protein